MKKITVNASKNYDVMIGSGIMETIGIHAKELVGSGKAAVITDSNVHTLYGKCVSDSMMDAGFEVFCYSFPAGEESKNSDTYLGIVHFLAQNHFTRTDVVIALGGGVVGDIAGFSAATYLRGIPFIQIPTTLLAMVDSSVGGKTAIDLPQGKNLLGAFYQPILVLCDTDACATLPREVFLDGCAEVIKYGILYDHELFDHLANHTVNFDKEYVIARCVELKAQVVCADEFDTGVRMRLNLGHTIGHGVEALSNYTISHGKAVAIGTAIITRSAEKSGLCDHETADRIISLLHSFALPTQTNFSAEALCSSALSDKKRAGGFINLVIPRAIGLCDIYKSPITELKPIIEAGL